MDEPRLPSATTSSSCPLSLSHPRPITPGIAPSDEGAPIAKRPRVASEPLTPGKSVRGPEADVRALVSMAGGLYPLGRAQALRGLAVVLENADASGGAARGVVECCYGCAAELMRDNDEDIRLAVVRLLVLCAQKLAARVDVGAEGNGDQIDVIFLQLSAMARDMCMKVRVEVFDALGKMQRVSESILRQSLSKKILRTVLGVPVVKGLQLHPTLKLPCVAGIFAHGIEDEFYQVRIAACRSMGALAQFSAQYAQKAWYMLMDMMNDDTEAVRLQTLQALFHMATYGCLNVQEEHMHMFLGLLVDANALIREAARKILGLVNLSKLQVFKSAVDGLIISLEKHPEEQDIYGVLFSIGKNHGSFSANIAKHVAKEISMASDGELILDKPRIKALLIVSISVFFSDDKHKKLDIPSVIFPHAISLVGKVSSALGKVFNQDILFSYLFHKGGLPFLENRFLSAESGQSEGCSFETVGEDSDCREENIAKATKCLDGVLVMQSTKFILQTVEEAWTIRRSCNISDARTVLRTCKEELKLLSENSSGSAGAFLSYMCEYLDAIGFIVEILQLIQSENYYAFGHTSLDVLVEKLDLSIRRMECCYAGVSRELEVQILELALVANLFRLSKNVIYPKQVLDKLHWVINRLEALCSDGSCEQSDFVREIKKVVGANSVGNTLVGNIGPLLELFHLKPTTDYGMLKVIRAVLQVCDSENPLLYVCGLPVGVRFSISVWNVSSHHRLWLRMAVGASIQYTFVEISCFGGDEELRTCSMVVPLYATPMACSFVLRVCLVMECPYRGISTHKGGHGGPSDRVVQLSDELDICFVGTGQT